MMTVSKHVEKFWIVLVDEKNTISLFSGLCDLFSEGHYFMFFIISVFSVLFPLSKIGLCGALISSSLDREIKHKITSLLYHAGKWSMLDVFVVGILVTTIKLGSVAEVSMHSGVFWFALSVLLSFWRACNISSVKVRNTSNPAIWPMERSGIGQMAGRRPLLAPKSGLVGVRPWLDNGGVKI